MKEELFIKEMYQRTKHSTVFGLIYLGLYIAMLIYIPGFMSILNNDLLYVCPIFILLFYILISNIRSAKTVRYYRDDHGIYKNIRGKKSQMLFKDIIGLEITKKKIGIFLYSEGEQIIISHALRDFDDIMMSIKNVLYGKGLLEEYQEVLKSVNYNRRIFLDIIKASYTYRWIEISSYLLSGILLGFFTVISSKNIEVFTIFFIAAGLFIVISDAKYYLVIKKHIKSLDIDKINESTIETRIVKKKKLTRIIIIWIILLSCIGYSAYSDYRYIGKANELIPDDTKQKALVIDELKNGFISYEDLTLYYDYRDYRYKKRLNEEEIVKKLTTLYDLKVEDIQLRYKRVNNLMLGDKYKGCSGIKDFNPRFVTADISIDNIEIDGEGKLSFDIDNKTDAHNGMISIDGYNSSKRLIGRSYTLVIDIKTGKHKYIVEVNKDSMYINMYLSMDVEELKRLWLKPKIEKMYATELTHMPVEDKVNVKAKKVKSVIEGEAIEAIWLDMK